MKWSGNSSRVEVTPGRGWYLYALMVILLGSCLCLGLFGVMVSTMGSG